MLEDPITPRPGFPFSAIVGQDDYKLALLANAVDPSIGGVLAIGDRGTAKTTLARSFASLTPRFGARAASSSESSDAWSDEALDSPELEGEPVEPAESAPFIELPLGATVDRVVGSIDTAKLLSGEGAELQPGLLARADGGILYADEVNLLGDHLVDVLLDAAAFGVIRVERDGLSAEQSAQFVLVGTMNPEEGALRPQLLDRFGLSVEIESPADSRDRAEIIVRRLAFDRDGSAFAARFAGTEAALREIVSRARKILPEVELAPASIEMIASVCTALGVEGMRADIVTARTATALAALDGRVSVIERDIVTAARLALPHRAYAEAGSNTRIAGAQISAAVAESFAGSGSDSKPSSSAAGGAGERGSTRSAPTPRTPAGQAAGSATGTRGDRPDVDSAAAKTAPSLSYGQSASNAIGRGARASGGMRPPVDTAAFDATAAFGAGVDADLDVIATARAAVTRRLFGGGPEAITAQDLRAHVRSGRDANLVLCVVDASSSVLENGRAGELRALLGGLVADARRKRDRVGLVVFRGREARLVAPPSRNHAAVLAGLDTIEPGGTTPLAEGIRVAHETAVRELRRNPELRPIVALVTDGYANVARSGDALGEARIAAHKLKRDGIMLVVIGETKSGAPDFARTTGAEFYPFDPTGDQRRVA